MSQEPANETTNPDKLKVLIELYKAAVEEYRFQVNLNWDRNKFYILLNSALITSSCGLLRIPGFQFAAFLTTPLFVLGILVAWLGYMTLMKGIEYRREAVIKKAQIESKLKNYSDIIPVDTTQGMKEAKNLINNVDDVDKYVKKPLRIGTINYFLATLFIFLIAVNGIALLYLFFNGFFLRS